MNIGAIHDGKGSTRFRVWAPFRNSVSVRIVKPYEQIIPMVKDNFGYWEAEISSDTGVRYFYRLDDVLDRPDPASFSQPEDVHGPSEVIDHTRYKWNDRQWQGISLDKMIIYEIHTGTFTKDGTFDGILKKLEYLTDLGITAIELMPLAQFPQSRNWGYDGAYPFAVQSSYGGSEGLKRLVDKCHQSGLAVIIDVVYNHLGPEGTYLLDYGPYFTDKYHTPWGDAVNFDGPWSDGVRNFFIQNALSWFEFYHIDGLRLDAIQGIYDFGAKHILAEISEKTAELSKHGRKRYLIAESDLDDIRVITPVERNGYGMDAQWSDDFHHSIHALLTGDRKSYYADFGTLDHLLKAYRDGFVYSWTYSPNRRRHHGSSSKDFPGDKFVICLQNHDQIGNRVTGERLSMMISFDALKLAAGALFVAPYIPLLFMGEEVAAETPFLYFISHFDKNLVQAVRDGRAKEFSEMHQGGEAPDPQSPETFKKCILNWEKNAQGKHREMFNYYKKLISLRKEIPALRVPDKKNTVVTNLEGTRVLMLTRSSEKHTVTVLMNFSNEVTLLNREMVSFSGRKIFDSQEWSFEGEKRDQAACINRGDEIKISGFGFIMFLTEPEII